MQSEPLIFVRIFNTTRSNLWKAITNKDDMKKWYFDIVEFKPEAGFEFQFSAGPDNGKKYLHLCKITEVIFNKKLAYSWRFDGIEGNSLLTFEIFSEGDKTGLRLTHEGIETFPGDDPNLSRDSFTQGWTSILDKSLKEYLER